MSTGLAHQNSKFTKVIENFAHIVDPAPVNASVFLDEDEYSIQNGAIGIEPEHTRNYSHWNLPGIRHNVAATISFADGHAENWRWKDKWIPDGAKMLKARFQQNPFMADSSTPSSSQDRDLKRLQKTVPF